MINGSIDWLRCLAQDGTLGEMIPEFLLDRAKVAAGALSGVLGFTLTDALTNQWVLAGGASLFAAIAGGGIVAAFAKVISARAGARSAAFEALETGNASLFRRQADVHAVEILFYQNRLAYKDFVSTLEQTAKHKILGECQRLNWHITELNSMLKSAGVEPPEFALHTYETLVGAEDAQIQAAAQARFQVTNTLTKPAAI